MRMNHLREAWKETCLETGIIPTKSGGGALRVSDFEIWLPVAGIKTGGPGMASRKPVKL